MSIILRGDIFYADLSPVVGTEQGGIKPVVIVQNNIGNRYSPIVIAAPITTMLDKPKLPTHVEIKAKDSKLNKDGVLILEQLRVLDKSRLREKICQLDSSYIYKLDKALMIALSLSINKSFSPAIAFAASNNSKVLQLAINILQNVLKNLSSNDAFEETNIEKEYIGIDVAQIYSDMAKLSEKMDCIHTDMKPFLRKTSIAKGIINEQAVIDYFNKIKKPRHKEDTEDYLYKAEKADPDLDHLKIDVIAKNRRNKIFIQVKAGKIRLNELETVVENIKNLDIKYNEENLNKIACICADTFPQDIELQRLDLEEKYNIKIMLIHKYQILQLDSCKRYERAIK